jgi:nifR3 family TIM-barrel protein
MMSAVASPAKLLSTNSPFVLAPMAGITNSAFRTLAREAGAEITITEMVTARALIEEHPETLRLLKPAQGESPRSIQLYGVDPKVIALAIKYIGENNLADHIDLNFGCPVPKVTRRGGGAALPFKRKLFQNIVTSAVNAGREYQMPVSVKMRMGIDVDHPTYLESAKAALDAGVVWVALHARYANEMYDTEVHWESIANLVALAKPYQTPVLGNGNVWSGLDGVEMIKQTGCDGVVVGRGCLGRPWLFHDLNQAYQSYLAGRPVTYFEPELDYVRKTMFRHGQLLVDFFENEGRAMRDFRKHVAWYLKGFRVEREIRSSLGMVSSLSELDYLLSQIENQPYPTQVADAPRGRNSKLRPTTLPQDWLLDPDEIPAITIDDSISGG